GIIYFQEQISALCQFQSGFMQQIWDYTALSLAAQLATFPLSIFYFHQFPVYFLLANLWMLIPSSVILYGGIVLLLIPFTGFRAFLGEWLSQVIVNTNQGLQIIENLPFSSLYGIWISPLELSCIFLLGVLLVLRTYDFQRLGMWIAFVLLTLSCSISIRKWENATKQEMLFFSLNSHLAFSYMQSGGTWVFADFDENAPVYANIIKPALESMGRKAN